MDQTRTVGRTSHLIRLRLGDHLLHTFDDGDLASCQTAVALLRTVFEDHHVDPDHHSCLFFHGCTIFDSRSASHDFSVVHRQGRMILSEFTFQRKGPSCVSLPLDVYAREVVGFAERVLACPPPALRRPEWQEQYFQTQRGYLETLTGLGRRLLAGEPHEQLREEFYHAHGRLKRPLIVQVLSLLNADEVKPREPHFVEARTLFGPLSIREVVPMRLNGGDVVLVTVERFTRRGAMLQVEGVGSGGLRQGDRLHGLQLFYP